MQDERERASLSIRFFLDFSLFSLSKSEFFPQSSSFFALTGAWKSTLPDKNRPFLSAKECGTPELKYLAWYHRFESLNLMGSSRKFRGGNSWLRE